MDAPLAASVNVLPQVAGVDVTLIVGVLMAKSVVATVVPQLLLTVSV